MRSAYFLILLFLFLVTYKIEMADLSKKCMLKSFLSQFSLSSNNIEASEKFAIEQIVSDGASNPELTDAENKEEHLKPKSYTEIMTNNDSDRKNALKILKDYSHVWVIETAFRNDIQITKEVPVCKMLVFGSFFLNTHTLDSDIDVILCVPYFVDVFRDFFGHFKSKLLDDVNVSELVSIENAKTPIIKCCIKSIKFDITCVSIANYDLLNNIREIKQNITEQELDRPTQRILNGYISNKIIGEAVPNFKKFSKVCRFIKLWSKAKGIYSHILGYLSGISLSIMVAIVCINNQDLS